MGTSPTILMLGIEGVCSRVALAPNQNRHGLSFSVAAMARLVPKGTGKTWHASAGGWFQSGGNISMLNNNKSSMPNTVNLKHQASVCTGLHFAIRVACGAALAASATAYASPSGIGLGALLTANPDLNGSGINVAQVEASLNHSPPPDTFEVNPAQVNQPQSKFTYINSSGTQTTTYNPTDGSSHADGVGALFYGGAASSGSSPTGVAPGVTSISNYDAGGFAGYNVGLTENTATQMITPTTNQHATVNNAAVINQSFIFPVPSGFSSAQADEYLQNIDWGYDSYVNTYHSVIVSAVGDYSSTSGQPDMINAPATAYNSISVGTYGGATEVGPTFDGRSKPDIVAPGGASSYAAPLVSGAAALLIQAGNQAAGYTVASAGSWSQSQYAANAVLPQTVKALLLNGAVQPTGWTHTDTAPLDARYGAGVLNVNNAFQNLAAGRTAVTVSNTDAAVLSTPTITQGSGWDVESLSNNGPHPGSTPVTYVNHYVFTAATIKAGSGDAFKATLVWNAQTTTTGGGTNLTFSEKQTPIYLELFNAQTDALVSESVSTVDNVQQVDALLMPGTNYDLQVLTSGSNFVSSDTYALAFSTTAISIATPEPAACALLAAAGAVVLLGRKWRKSAI